MAGERPGGTSPNAQATQAMQAAVRDLDEWQTGDDHVTETQRSYLRTLARGERPEDVGPTKAAAVKRIEGPHRRTGRGPQSRLRPMGVSA
jgi:hypothetical protein